MTERMTDERLAELEQRLEPRNAQEAFLALKAERAEVARLKAGGCARDQNTTQYCAEAAELAKEVERLDSLLSGALEEKAYYERSAQTAEALLDKVERQLRGFISELRHTFTALPDLTNADPNKVDEFVRNLLADELEEELTAILAKRERKDD